MFYDGVSFCTYACAEEEVGDVAAANLLAVDVIRGFALPRQLAFDGDFGITPPRALQCAAAVVKHEFHRGARGGAAGRGAVEITSCMDSPRSCLAEDSPSTQRTASMTLDLPQPLGPITAVRRPGVRMAAGSAKDLKPEIFIWVRRMCFQAACAAEKRADYS